jgi:tetratricopeptide (TPR) repeat protein
MSIDPYSRCPGGLNKKIQFCCSDLLPELEKMSRRAESDQSTAYLDYLERLDRRVPKRACVLSAKADALMSLNRLREAAQAVDEILAEHPTHSHALARKALILSQEGRAMEAVSQMQDAIAASGDDLPTIVLEWFGNLAQYLLITGNTVSAIQHLLMYQVASQEPENESAEILALLFSSQEVPAQFKELQRLKGSPPDQPWSERFAAAHRFARTLRWKRAEAEFNSLASEVPASPEVWWNLATVRGWLADAQGAAAAWRRLAELDIPLANKVDAEAIALLFLEWKDEAVPYLRMTADVDSVEDLETRLAADKRFVRASLELDRLAGEDQVPPKSGLSVWDRPLPEPGTELRREDLPRSMGMVFVFGRQTDKPARIEWMTWEDHELESRRAQLQEMLGPAVHEFRDPITTNRVEVLRAYLDVPIRVPDGTNVDVRDALEEEESKDRLGERLLNRPWKCLGGRSLREAAKDASNHVRSLAMLQLIELKAGAQGVDFDGGTARARLGLPALEPINPAQTEPEQLSIGGLLRLDVTQLSNEQLDRVERRAHRTSCEPVVTWCMREIVKRADWNGTASLEFAHGWLSNRELNSRSALEHVRQAQKLADPASESAARWALAEVTLHLARGDVEAALQAVSNVQDNHGKKPGVMRSLLQTLLSAGMLPPEALSSLRGPLEGVRLDIKSRREAETSKIWTPESESLERPRAALWTPGSD